MPIYQDDFQSYSLGTTSPWGSLVEVSGSGSISNTATPDGLIGPYGQTQYLDFGGTLQFNDGISRSSGSIFFAALFPSATGFYTGANLLVFQTGVPGSTFPSAGFRVNLDGTLTPTDRNGNPLGAFIGVNTTSEVRLRLDTWHFFQFNVEFSVVGGSLQVVYTVEVDGQVFITGTQLSGSAPSSFWVNTTIQGTLRISDLTIDVLQAINTLPTPGTPVAHVTNQVIELVMAPIALAIACPFGAAQVGVPYDVFIPFSGGTGPWTFSKTSGSFPAGLDLVGTTNELKGTPTTAGTPTYTIQVEDSLGATASATCSVPVVSAASPPTVSCPPKTTAQLFNSYSSFAGASGGVGPYTWALTSGSLPTGLSLNTSTGEISGNPTVLGMFTFSLTVTDSLSHTSDPVTCSITVSNTPPARFCVAQA